jgi:hypothetical protein
LRHLNANGLAIDNANVIAALAQREFESNAGLSEFLLWSVFLRIADWWGNNQAVPTAELVRVQTGLLGPLKTWLASDRSFRDPNCIADVLTAVQKTLR